MTKITPQAPFSAATSIRLAVVWGVLAVAMIVGGGVSWIVVAIVTMHSAVWTALALGAAGKLRVSPRHILDIALLLLALLTALYVVL